MPVFRSTCPRNCYGSCGMLSHINGNKLTRVLGDPEHGYSKGRLCAKGYAMVQYALDDNRLKYPLLKIRRGSGNWRRISWDQAYEILAEKYLELYKIYGSNLAAGYYKGAGNQGFLHYATEGMYAGLGAHTYPEGKISITSGFNALGEVIDEYLSPDPEEMVNSKLIVLWGANPAVTNVHQMKFIYQARKEGGQLVVIDPILSVTGERADFFIQIRPGMDAWLAWGIAKHLLANKLINEEYLLQNTKEWQRYKQHLMNVKMEEVQAFTGVRIEVIEELANLFAKSHPSANWLGIGLQRNRFGGEAVRAISALAAMTGNFGYPGGGLYFRHQNIKDFPLALAKPIQPHAKTYSRKIPINNFAHKALDLQDPPLKLLWISCGNPLAQDHSLQAWEKLLRQLDFVVTVDLYLTRTAQESDMILPAASFFEAEDLHLSNWHYWLSINQKALPAFYETKSDLQIAREFSTKLNTLKPGFSTFPAEKEPLDWIESELTPHIRQLYDLDQVSDLYNSPKKLHTNNRLPRVNYQFSPPTPESLISLTESSQVKRFESDIGIDFPYYLFTPQSLLKIHTQYETLAWLNPESEALIEVSEDIAHRHGISNGSQVKIFNQYGSLRGMAKVNHFLPPKMVVVGQSDQYSINALISGNASNGSMVNFFDCKVNLKREPSYV